MIKIGLTDYTPENKILRIRNKNHEVKAEYAIGAKDILKRSLMSEHHIEFSFVLNRRESFVRSDYIEWDRDIYTLRADYIPEQVNKRNYKYELRFEAVEMFFQDIQYYYLNQGLKESEWRLIGNPEYFLKIALDNINRYFGVENEFLLGTVEAVSTVDISFSTDTNVFDALTQIAEQTGCEWYMTGKTLHLLKKITLGTEVDFETDTSVLSMSRQDGEPSTGYTRIVALGSTRNIPRDYRAPVAGESVDAIYSKRLRIPVSAGDVIDAYPDMSPEEIVEGTVIFDDVYPKRIGTIEAIGTIQYTDTDEETGDTTKWNAFKFKDTGINFKEEYVLPGEELRLMFQSGDLNGRDFALYFHKTGFSDTDDSQYFEIVRTDDYGTLLPNDTMKPKVGDQYVMYGFDIALVSDQYVPEAERELLDTATEWLQNQLKDTSVYECPTSIQYFTENKMELEIGQKIRLVMDGDVPDRLSRIMGYEKKLNNVYDAVYTVGDNPTYSRFAALENDVKELQFAGTAYASGGGNNIYLIKQFDATKPTDFNVMSAARSMREFLSKTQADEAKGYINFVRGIGLASKLLNDILRVGDREDPSNQNVYSALRVQKEIEDVIEGLDDRYLRKEVEDAAQELIKFLKGIDVRDAAIFRDSIDVMAAAVFRNSLNSPDFVSGSPDGKGWAILTKEYLNAAGVTEHKSYAEFDELTVRGALNVIELVVNQLKGESDNYIFSGMMKVDSIDAATDTIYFDTADGSLYNPFRAGDILICQRYGGGDYDVIKQYEFIVTQSGAGSGDPRLDWVKYSGFKGRVSDVAAGDVVVRVDSVSDYDRKGIVMTTSLGEGAPYIDVAHGLKTDPDDALKVRIGRLTGVYNLWFGWLKGFGAYIQNLYAVGEFHFRNGENIRTRLDMMENLFRVDIQKTQLKLTEDDNFLRNAAFTENMEFWQVDNDLRPFTVGGRLLMFNNNLYINKEGMAAVTNYEGRNMLRIRNSGIRQRNEHLRKPDAADSTLYLSFKYLCTGAGTLTCGFEGSAGDGALPFISEEITAGFEFETRTYSGTWDGLGDFVLAFTGDIYIDLLSVTCNALDDYKVEVSTKFEQTAERITLEGQRIDNLAQTTSQLTIELDAANERIGLVSQRVDASADTISQLTIELDAANDKISIMGERIDGNAETLTQMGLVLDQTNEQLSIYAQKTDEISSTVSDQGMRLDAAESQITIFSEFRNSAEGTLNSLGVRMDSAEGTLDIYATALDDLGNSMTNMGTRMNATEGTLTTYVEKTDTISGDVTSLTSRMSATEAKFGQYVLTETYIGFKTSTEDTLASQGESIGQAEDSILRQWTAIEQTDRSLSFAINKSTGYPIHKDIAFGKGLNNLQLYNASGGVAVDLTHIPIHYGQGVPTASNYPASTWDTAALKLEHVGDVYQNLQTGMYYTYTSSYTWQSGAEFVSAPSEQPGIVRVRKLSGASSPGLGGFAWAATPRPNLVLQLRFTAKIPTGYTLNFDCPFDESKYQGEWFTDRKGNGKWRDYKYEMVFADDESLEEAAATLMRVYLTRDSGGAVSSTIVTWYLSYGTVFDLSSYEDPVAYINLTEGLAKIKADRIELEGAISANGNFSIDTDGNLIAKNATIEGAINAKSGYVGGFEIASGRIGVASSNPESTTYGLSLYDSFIKFADQYRWAAIGTNTLAPSTGHVAVGRFLNKTPNDYQGQIRTNYGLIIDVQNATNNIALLATGDIVASGSVSSYGFATITPSTNTVHTVGELTSPTMFKIIARFVNSNSGLGFPTRSSVASKLGISSTTPFAVVFTVMCSADSTQSGTLWGRNTTVSGMNSVQYPQMLDNNAIVQTGDWAMSKGDINQFMLVWDNTNYRAYLMNVRN